MTPIDRLLRLGQKGRVFPGAVALASQKGRTVIESAWGAANLKTGELVAADTVFDLASLTKPLVTAVIAMRLMATNRLKLNEPIGSALPSLLGTDKSELTVEQLLRHTSGLPDYRPYYLRLGEIPAAGRAEVVLEWITREPLEAFPGTRTLYSDLGFILLQFVLESLAASPLDALFLEEVSRPLGIADLFFSNDRDALAGRSVAATEVCPWRGATIRGEVHDENAHCLGGVAGHAGLFGTAAAVERLLSELMTAWHGGNGAGLFPADLVRQFFDRPDSGMRPLGFDAPSPEFSSCGRCFSRRTVGHLGFTGTSFWMDLERQIIIVLLTNRVHPSRENDRIRRFRPCVHNRIMSILSKCKFK
ncbi:MAG: serine hydrolase domain-containing protein [Desulfobacterales bacterium]